MFVGHLGVAFGGKRLEPELSLGALFLAAQFLDLLSPLFAVFGFGEVQLNSGQGALTPLSYHDYPYTHSLAASAVWGLLLGGVYLWRKRSRRAATLILGLVLSNWILDFIVHKATLPLAPGSDLRVGLGLGTSLPATIIVELGIFVTGLAFYVQATSPRRGRKTWGPWGLVAALLVIQVLYYFGPPPPNEFSIILAGFGQWILVPWAFWIDRRRETKAFRSDALFRLGAE